MRIRDLAWRVGLLTIAAAIVPACKGDKFVAPALFSDGFNGTFPGTDWVTSGAATVAIDSGEGAPPPSLKVSAPSASTSVTATTVSAFNNPTITFSVSMSNESTATTELGTGTVSILNATPAVVASATWDNATGTITFHTDGATDATSIVLPANLTFHRIVFGVTAAGTAFWQLDNGGAVAIRAGFPAGPLKLQLGGAFGTGSAWPSFFFDNVTVTSP